MSLQRRAPMKRTPFARKPAEARHAARSKPLARSVGHRRTRRSAGEFSAQVRLDVRTRAGRGDPEQACCEACAVWLGAHGGQIQHRLGRKMGGSKRPVIRSAANAALLCGTPQSGCHGLCESRDPAYHAGGFWLDEGQDPAVEPILLASDFGVLTVWLAPEGWYLSQAPEAVAS